MDDVMPFGRHQGYTIEEILKDRPEYIYWLVNNTSLKFYPSVLETLNLYNAAINNAYKPRRIMYRADWSPDDYEQDLIFGDWSHDVPF